MSQHLQKKELLKVENKGVVPVVTIGTYLFRKVKNHKIRKVIRELSLN